jgi:hypothetical protein
MSITARLHIEGHSKEKEGIRVLSCNFGFRQDVDARGMQTSRVKPGLINLTVKGTEDAEIVQWMFSQDSMKNGKITYSGFTGSGPVRKVIFQDAILVSYSENFTDQSDIIINLTISARKITIAGIDFETFWSDKLNR